MCRSCCADLAGHLRRTEGCSRPRQGSAGRTGGCHYCEAVATSADAVTTGGHDASSEAERLGVAPATGLASASQFLAPAARTALGDGGDLSCFGRCCGVDSSSTSVAHCFRSHCHCTTNSASDPSRSDEDPQALLHLLAFDAIAASFEATVASGSPRSAREASRGSGGANLAPISDRRSASTASPCPSLSLLASCSERTQSGQCVQACGPSATLAFQTG